MPENTLSIFNIEIVVKKREKFAILRLWISIPKCLFKTKLFVEIYKPKNWYTKKMPLL